MALESESIRVPEGVKVTLVDEAIMGTEAHFSKGVRKYVEAGILSEP